MSDIQGVDGANGQFNLHLSYTYIVKNEVGLVVSVNVNREPFSFATVFQLRFYLKLQFGCIAFVTKQLLTAWQELVFVVATG